jgi:hypothetical protein
MAALPPEYLDPNTPPDVVVTDLLRPRIDDPTLGVALGQRDPAVPAPPTDPVHRLVTVGDSLTHGLTSGAVSRTDLSWPAVLARCLDVPFQAPAYGGPLGGLPFNIEGLLRKLQEKFGVSINLFEVLDLPATLHQLADQNEDYWERGDGSRPPRTDVRYDNLGIYGWDIRDCLSYTGGRASARIASNPAHDDLLGAIPSNDNDIAAWSVLAPFGVTATQIGAAAWHGGNGGIDTLVIVLGGNNALRTVVDKKVLWTGDGFDDLDRKGSYNVWRPTHFAAEFAELVRAVEAISTRRVVFATVPHLTILPIANGVNPQAPGQKWRPGSRYFPFYTDPWIDEQDFDPAKHRHLTHQQARAIDSAIDQYNDTIAEAVRHARSRGRDWFAFDLCGVLDGLAYRRFVTDDAAAANNDWQAQPLPPELADLDTRFFRSDRTGRLQGGLFGLDGVHPTTSGYGILAEELGTVLRTAGLATKHVDFGPLKSADTLNENPPALMVSVWNAATPFLARLVSRDR